MTSEEFSIAMTKPRATAKTTPTFQRRELSWAVPSDRDAWAASMSGAYNDFKGIATVAFLARSSSDTRLSNCPMRSSV